MHPSLSTLLVCGNKLCVIQQIAQVLTYVFILGLTHLYKVIYFRLARSRNKIRNENNRNLE